MGCGVGRAVVSFRVLGTGGGCVVGKKEDVKLNSARKLFASQEGFRACAKTFLPVTELEPSWHVPERTGGAGGRVGFDTLSAGRGA